MNQTMKNIYLTISLGIGWLCFLQNSSAQPAPAIYTGGDNPCFGKQLGEYRQKCLAGDVNACRAFEEEQKRISEECNSDGTEAKSTTTKPPVKTITPPPPESRPDGGEVGPEKPTKPTTCWYKRGTLTENTNGYLQFKYCEVQAPPNCGNCIHSNQRSFGSSLPIGEVLMDNLLLSYIPIAEKKNNDLNSTENLIPFSLGNSIQSWMTSDRDETMEYDFKFIIPGKSHAWLATSGNNYRPIRNLEAWLFQSTGNEKEDEKRKSFLYKIAAVAAQDPNFEMIERPTKTNLKAVITGNYEGRFPYLIGIGDNYGYYTPVNLVGEVDASRRLIQSLKNGSVFSEPLGGIIKEWHRTGNERTVVACVEGGRPGKYRNPNEAWNSGSIFSSSSNLNNLTFILSDGSLLGKNINEEIKAPWFDYRIKNLKNPYLALLAVADPYSTVLEVIDNKALIILTGNPDDLYAIILSNSTSSRNALGILRNLPPSKRLDEELIEDEASDIKSNPSLYSSYKNDVRQILRRN